MARKLLSPEEAAQILNVTPEEVHQFRESQQLYGLRDGGTWKFKEEDVERLAEERRSGGGSSGLSGTGLSGIGAMSDVRLDLGEPDSVLLSEQELGKSPETTSSTIIGKKKKPSDSESDIHLAASAPPPLKKKPNSSDLQLAAASDLNLAPSDSGKKFEELDDFIGMESNASGLDLAATDSGKGLAGASDISLSDNLKQGSSSKGHKGESTGSSIKLTDDDELVLGGSGSDVTLGTGDSGIGLSSPSDSGLNLEEPLELGGSNIEMMELGEDDVVSLEEDADLEAATQLKADDEFLLTPSAGAEDSSDSGSQVIALEGDEMFGQPEAGAGMLVEDQGAMAGVGIGMAAMGGVQPGTQVIYAPAVPEAPYTIWNVLALFLCIVFLLIAGMFIFDLARNMWSWDNAYDLNSKMMDAVLKWFEK
ncbi:MAG TPA: helix-turn-helix domain-containing protein [Pirellulales bacterium]|jgi:hypothetical protein|nr:helix-turn-helix domain-containing protein [Pirellulales bacterium]